MSIPSKYKGKYFYHFTHIENLESILQHGLLCTNKKNENEIDHKNVASENIQHRRSEMDVTCAPNGKVHDYVPFYFASINPMLLSLTNKKNIDQPFMIFLAIPIEKILEKNVIFSDASANTIIPPNFYNSPEDLDKLDWDAIDSRKWSSNGEVHMHNRMAEALIHDNVPLDWITDIIVWNKYFMNFVDNIYIKNGLQSPKITYQPFHGRYFYFTKFGIQGRSGETLVTGPNFLKNKYKEIKENIIEKRKGISNFTYPNIKELVDYITDDFCVLSELSGIYELKTDNAVHSENVSDHTIAVVENLNDDTYFLDLSEDEQDLVILSAYLHDIGKGPHSKWKDGIQKNYPDHPADSLKMLERILSEDIEDLTKDQIRQICLLVAYHDLIGDIVGNGRSKIELIGIIDNEKDLNMLIAISLADTLSLSKLWYRNIKSELPKLIEEVQKNIL